MPLSFFSPLQNLWPFSRLTKQDDLTISNQLTRRLSIPDQTKQFVFAFQEPGSEAVVYILAVENLSEQSAIDSVHLIKEVRPKAVIAQITPAAVTEIQTEEKCLNGDEYNTVPTSSFGILKKCFTDKLNKDLYEKIASCQVVQEIFGVGFYGNFLAAKKAAKEVKSVFLLLESPYDNGRTDTDASSTTEGELSSPSSALHLQASCLVPGQVASIVNPNFQRLRLTDALQSQMVKSLIPSLNATLSLNFAASGQKSDELQPVDNFDAPPFARAVYPLLADLYTIFSEIPLIEKALASSQKMLECIHKGNPISGDLLHDVYTFRIAIEGLRIALASAAKSPINKVDTSSNSAKLEFSQLSTDEKCQVLFAQALKSKAKKLGTIVAIVDAGLLYGIRRHWNTPVPSELEDVSSMCFTQYMNEDETGTDEDKFTESTEKKKLSDKPMVAVGAGATAIWGATSLSKAFQASTIFKVSSYKVPWVLKHGLAQLQRNTILGLSKTLAPSKLSGLKFTVSAEKIRLVTHSVISSVERTSLLAMRTSFYEIMQKRGAKSVRIMPWVTFGFSMSMCCGLLVYGDGIECAAEVMPAVPSIASLGRGLESLRNTSMEVRQTNGSKIQDALQSFMHNLKEKMRGR